MKLLHIDSSILGEGSASRTLTREVVSHWQAAHPGAKVTHLDLAAEELPHLSGKSLARADATEAARNDRTLQDFLDAEVVVIGAPMYNFSIPSQLKGWIDRVMVAGKTFRYTASGPEGLAGCKKVVVAITRGGVDAADAAGKSVETYLKFILGFMGIHDVTFVRAEGLALSAEHRTAALSTALAAIPAPLALAA